MKKISISFLKLFGLYKVYTPPAHIVSNFISIDEASMGQLKTDIVQHYLKGQDLNLEEVQNDLKDHLTRRLESFRSGHIPFLDAMAG